MTTPQLGRDCTIKKNGTAIGFARNVNVTIDGNVVDIGALGDEWTAQVIGRSKGQMSFSYLYVTGNTEQNAIESAAFNRTTLNDISLYLDATTYVTVDTATDADACFIVTSFGYNTDLDGAVEVPVTLDVRGPLHTDTD